MAKVFPQKKGRQRTWEGTRVSCILIPFIRKYLSKELACYGVYGSAVYREFFKNLKTKSINEGIIEKIIYLSIL